MKFSKTLRTTGGAVALALLSVPALATPQEVGVWYDDTGKGAVKIEICTETTLCGKIYWLKEPNSKNGKPLTDGYNPDPSMRKRPICGLMVLEGLEQQSNGGFDNGKVYDPKTGKQYSAALDLLAPDKLQLTGYALSRMLGKSFIWTRAPDDLPSCAPDAASSESGDAAGQKTKKTPAASKLGASDVPAPVPAKHKKKAAGAATPQHPVASN